MVTCACGAATDETGELATWWPLVEGKSYFIFDWLQDRPITSDVDYLTEQVPSETQCVIHNISLRTDSDADFLRDKTSLTSEV
jgi:hypothetical protein